MSNEQIIQGIVKFHANPRTPGSRMNAVISTVSGDVKAWATDGTNEGEGLKSLRKGQTAQLVVDGKGNFLRLANAPAPQPQAMPQVTNGQPMYQTPAPVQAPAPGVGLQQVDAMADLLKACHDAVDARFPDNIDPEFVRQYATTLYISLTR